MTSRSFIIEGIDRLGKSTLIEGLQHKLGYFQVIHYQKPQVLECYEKQEGVDPLQMYQTMSFYSMFDILRSNARVILDRAHLGETVYAPIYRGYSGSYVFDIEQYSCSIHDMSHVRMILLTENFEISKHFVDDGESFDPAKRKEEQGLFIEAFNKSALKDKRIVCVTDESTGMFKDKEAILNEVCGH
jgi:thymidylate kinase